MGPGTDSEVLIAFLGEYCGESLLDINNEPPSCFRSRSPSTISRTRIQSDGSTENKKTRKSKGSITQTTANLLLHNDDKQKQTNEDSADKMSKISAVSTRRHSQQRSMGDHLDLENYCLHCSLGTEYRKNKLKNEIETAVKRLARRLGNNRSTQWDHKDESAANVNSIASNTPPTDSNPTNNTERMHRTITPGSLML